MSSLSGKTILVGVSGGIAAYKACALVSGLKKRGAAVHVMMTRNATNFVAPLSFETLSGNRVTVDTFDRDFTWEVEHVSLAKKADILVIAPATANVIAKLACGIADDFLTTTALACKCKKLIAPAMNSAMLSDPATQANLHTLSSRGYYRIDGADGRLACGDEGSGRMAEPDEIIERLQELSSEKHDYRGKRVLVTAGATRVELDPVRFISNRSSGKMGFSLARAAYDRGAEVVFVKGFTNDFDVPADWTVEKVETTEQMFSAVKKYENDIDVAILAAAPCDYEAEKSQQKIKATSLQLSLKKATDIAKYLGGIKKDFKLVIFAAETENAVDNARGKLKSKNADLCVLNDVTQAGAGFDVDTNIVTLVGKQETVNLPLLQKTQLSELILDKINEL